MTKSATDQDPRSGPSGAPPGSAPDAGAAAPPGRPARGRLRRRAVAIVVVALAAVGGSLGYGRYREFRVARAVKGAFAERRYDEARAPLARWLDRYPNSAEAHYYRAWLALVDDRPQEFAEAARRAFALDYDRESLEILQAIYQVRAGRINEAEPALRQAFDQGKEPRAEVAIALARIYLSTYRLTQAAEVVERCRELMPADARPYLWRNEIASRTNNSPDVLIRNYQAALDRDPGLDKARLGLAEELGKAGRYDEAEVEYRAYLERNPRDAGALVGLGRNALRNGEIDEAIKELEAAIAVDPRRADALKDLAQLDIRYGRMDQARRRLELLTQLEPYDHEARYSYSQALKFVGETEKARAEAERAAELRKDEERMLRLQTGILSNPNDLASRLEVARWMLDHGHVDEGLKWAREILRSDPRHAATHRVLADYYARQNNPGLANFHRTMAAGGEAGR